MHLLSITERFLYLFCGVGILQGVLMACLLYFHPKADRKVNTFIALYIFCTSLVMSLPIMIKMVGWQNSFFLMPIPLLPGPLLYLYLLSYKQRITWKIAWPHFIMFALFFFIVRWNLSVMSARYPNAVDIPPGALKRPITIVLAYIRAAQQLFYFYLAIKTLRSYRRSIKQLYSDTSLIDLNWAKFLVYGYLVLILAFMIIFPLIIQLPQHFNVLLLANMAIATPYIYIATYKGVMQPMIWQLKPEVNKEIIEEQIHEVEEIEEKVAAEDGETAKPGKTGLGAERTGEIVQKIIVLMEKERLYQEPELTLQQLAGKLDVPNYQVSLALNEGMKKNFYDLVNGYRVEEAKRLLAEDRNRNFTILSVGFEAGFNSKTTFNTVFKKFTGLTPTEFREKQKAGPVTA